MVSEKRRLYFDTSAHDRFSPMSSEPAIMRSEKKCIDRRDKILISLAQPQFSAHESDAIAWRANCRPAPAHRQGSKLATALVYLKVRRSVQR